MKKLFLTVLISLTIFTPVKAYNINALDITNDVFNVVITNITTKNVIGTASDNEKPSFDGLKANFNTNLKAPGDSITYAITIENKGKIDVSLNDIKQKDSNNPAITFEINGINKNDIIKPGEKSVLYVTTTYNKNSLTNPQNIVSKLSIDLVFNQKDSIIFSSGNDETITIGNVEVPKTSAFASAVTIILGLLLVIIAIIITKKMTEKEKSA